MNKKYEFTGITKQHLGTTLHQIRHVSDGLVGGWIEKEDNLSHFDNCFVFGNARVSGNACVSGDALVSGNAHVSGNAQVFGDALVFGNALVYGNAQVFGDARVSGDTQVSENARVSGNAYVSRNARVYGNAQVFGNAWVYGEMVCTVSPFVCQLTKHTITCSDAHISVGCEVHTFDHWLANVEAIGTKHRYTELEILNYKTIITGLVEVRKQRRGVEK